MRERSPWIIVALGLVLTATIVRLAINFSSAYPPGIDAAYYPLQTRSWLTSGRLMYDDLPLIFWFNAAVAKLLMARGWALDAALLQASRIVDCIGPPWMAAFVMAAGYEWSGGRRAALAGCTAAAAVTVLWPPAMTMLAEFQKNSLGLVWMTASIWACAVAMRRGGGLRRWLTLVAVLMLSVLTHVGAFAATAMIVGLALLVWLGSLWRRRAATLTQAARTMAGLTVGAASLVAVFFLFDPRRLRALLGAPATFLGRGPLWGHRSSGSAVTSIVVVIVVAFGLYRLWRDRRELSGADVGMVIAIAITALVLIGPNDPEYVRRLCLMAWVPVAMILAFVMARRAVAEQSLWPGRIFLALALLVSTGAVVTAERIVEPGMVTEQSAVELIDLRGQIPDPDTTLVISTHGHEWWAGYFLHTPVRVVSFSPGADNVRRLNRVATDARTRYARVLYLRVLVSAGPARAKAAAEAPESSFRRRHTNRAFELYEWQTR